jgi:hypothetical protein
MTRKKEVESTIFDGTSSEIQKKKPIKQVASGDVLITNIWHYKMEVNRCHLLRRGQKKSNGFTMTAS